MYVFGYSLDNISLMALTLCVGFVVDDAIVMLENIARHMEMGKSRLQATLDGSKEISFTILSMTISLAAVFIPVFFMGGIVGRLLHEFAVTIIAAVLISGFVSLTLTPMMCARILKPQHGAGHGRLYYGFRARLRGDAPGATSGRSSWSLAHAALRCWRPSSPSRSRPACCSSRMPKGFLPRRGHRAAVLLHRGGRRTFPSRPWPTCSSRSPRSCAATRTSKA